MRHALRFGTLILGMALPLAGAFAQGGPGDQRQMMQHRMATPPSDQQMADEINARLALLKAELRLTAEQQGQWGGFETALRDSSLSRMKQRVAMQAEQRSKNEAFRDEMRKWREERSKATDGAQPAMPRPPRREDASDIEQMRKMADTMSARAGEMRKIADAAAPLYGVLDEGQRRRLMDGIRQIGERGMGQNREGRMGRGGRDWDRDRR